MAKSVIGLFANEDAARTAWRALERAGFSLDQASFVDRATTRLAANLAAVGIPAIDTLRYVDSVKLGGVLLVLQALSDVEAERAAELLSAYDLVDLAANGEDLSQPGAAAPATSPDSPWVRPGHPHVYAGRETVTPIEGDEAHRRQLDVPPGGGVLDRKVAEYPPHENY